MADRPVALRSRKIMTAPVSLLGLASAVPAHVLDQKEVARRAHAIFAPTFARFPKLSDVFANSGIDRRYSIHPMSWFEREVDWSGRNKAYMAGAADLFVTAAESALARASRRASDIDMVVTVSSTGIATPSLEARVARRLGLRADVVRVPVFGLGCAGGVSGLALASRLARAEPGKTVLLVVVELCTLAFRSDRGSKADVIACALFGDGAAAAVLTAGPAPSTSWDGRSIRSASAWSCRAHCPVSSKKNSQARPAASRARRNSATALPASSAIRAAPRCWRASKRRSGSTAGR
jgi:alkylresorcinol/alkylpyrone synthase